MRVCEEIKWDTARGNGSHNGGWVLYRFSRGSGVWICAKLLGATPSEVGAQAMGVAATWREGREAGEARSLSLSACLPACV